MSCTIDIPSYEQNPGSLVVPGTNPHIHCYYSCTRLTVQQGDGEQQSDLDIKAQSTCYCKVTVSNVDTILYWGPLSTFIKDKLVYLAWLAAMIRLGFAQIECSRNCWCTVTSQGRMQPTRAKGGLHVASNRGTAQGLRQSVGILSACPALHCMGRLGGIPGSWQAAELRECGSLFLDHRIQGRL